MAEFMINKTGYATEKKNYIYNTQKTMAHILYKENEQ